MLSTSNRVLGTLRMKLIVRLLDEASKFQGVSNSGDGIVTTTVTPNKHSCISGTVLGTLHTGAGKSRFRVTRM